MKTFTALLIAATLAGCASVDMVPAEESARSKQFSPPAEGKAGIYVYRNSSMGKSLKKDLWVDGNCLGRSAPNTFFYTEVAGNQTHKIETESEFSTNSLDLMVESGKQYFVRQFIKWGVLVGGADLERVDDVQGRKDVAELAQAKAGQCDSPTPKR